MRDSTQYFQDLDTALENKTSVGAVLQRRHHESARRAIMPDETGDLDAERQKAEAALAAIEAREGLQRAAAAAWEIMLTQRDSLRTRLGNLGGVRQAIAEKSKELCDYVVSSIGGVNSEYNCVMHLGRMGATLVGIEKGGKLVDQAETQLRFDLEVVEQKLREFAAEHNIQHRLDEPAAAE